MSSIRPFGTRAKLLRTPCVKYKMPILISLMCNVKRLLFLRDLTPPPYHPQLLGNMLSDIPTSPVASNPVSYTEMTFEHVTQQEVTWKVRAVTGAP